MLVQVVDDLTERVGDLERRTAGIGRGVEPCPDRQMLVPYLINEEKPGCLVFFFWNYTARLCGDSNNKP